MPISQKLFKIAEELMSSISTIEMELKILKVQQLEIEHAIEACERAIKLSETLKNFFGVLDEKGNS